MSREHPASKVVFCPLVLLVELIRVIIPTLHTHRQQEALDAAIF